jgi:transcription antitermination factor NusA-like protein
MVKTIDMQEMRYLNLFESLTGVRTRFCFKYNENIIFCVPKQYVSRALGENARNIRKMSEILGKRIRVIAAPRGVEDSEVFIKTIISPLTIKDFAIRDGEIIIGGGKNKAALIGRNKRRFLEMQKVTQDFFEKDFRIA